MDSTATTRMERENLPELRAFARSQSIADDFHASLQAVRSSKQRAEATARRETRLARAALLGGMTFAVVAWTTVSRLTHPRPSVPLHAANAQAATIASTPAAATVAVTTTAPAAVTNVAEPPAAAAPAQAANGTDTTTACDRAFAAGHWRTVVSACEAAFLVHPKDAGLAMRVAQAAHRSGHIAESGTWAWRAIAIDASLPEAYAIVARAEAQAGNRTAEAAAYRRYLTLAPRGWHAAEAHRALGSK